MEHYRCGGKLTCEKYYEYELSLKLQARMYRGKLSHVLLWSIFLIVGLILHMYIPLSFRYKKSVEY